MPDGVPACREFPSTGAPAGTERCVRPRGPGPLTRERGARIVPPAPHIAGSERARKAQSAVRRSPDPRPLGGEVAMSATRHTPAAAPPAPDGMRRRARIAGVLYLLT